MFSLFQLVGLVLGCTRRPRAPRRGAAAGPRPRGRASRAPGAAAGSLFVPAAAPSVAGTRDPGRGEEGEQGAERASRSRGRERSSQRWSPVASRLRPAGRAAPSANGEAWLPRRSAGGAVRRPGRRRSGKLRLRKRPTTAELQPAPGPGRLTLFI